MQNLKLTFLAMTVFLISSCASIYQSPTVDQVSNKHQKIAILPADVSMTAGRKADPELLKEYQKKESLNFQKAMYSWFLKRKMQNGMRVNILDVPTTNAKLTKAGYFEKNTMTPNEIATLLGVDAVMTSNYALSKPMSEGAAVALGLLVGFWGATNQATITLDIHDKEAADIIWSYSHTLSGTIGSSSNNLVNALMKKASRKMPYMQPR